MSRDIGHSRWHVSRSRRRPDDRLEAADGDRCGGRVRHHPPAPPSTPGPVPGRRHRRDRATLPRASQQPETDAARGPRADRAAAAAAERRGPRRRPGHHRLAPRARGTPRAFDVHDPPHPARGRTDHPRAAQAPPVVVDPVRGGAAQRDLAVRLHPLATGRRQRRRDPQLAPHRANNRATPGDTYRATPKALETGEVLATNDIDPDRAYWRNTRRAPGRWPGVLSS